MEYSGILCINRNRYIGVMTMKKQTYQYDFCAMIGRLEPFHLGHARNLTQALEIANTVIIILGSANSPRTIENPFTVAERIEYITACIPEELRNRVKFNAVEDVRYQNLEWLKNVQSSVMSTVRDYYPGNSADAKICILGHDKDESSWYIKNFPWEVVDTGPYVKEKTGGVPLSATKIRELMYTNYLGYTESALPSAMYDWLEKFACTKEFVTLQEEYKADYAYLPHAIQQMANGVYATNFYCCDAVVIQSGHILLVQRGENPGKDLWALPGGHINANETSYEAVLRELEEETKIKVPLKVLKGSLRGEKLFDHPNRSLRGKTRTKNVRTATVSYCFKLTDGADLPLVKGSDDAALAWWFPLGTIATMRDQLFEDHASIIDYWVSRIDNDDKNV